MTQKMLQNSRQKCSKIDPKRSLLTLGVFGRLGGHVGAISEASWGSPGGVRERLERVSRELGGVWGASGARLGTAWERLGALRRGLGGV